MIKKTLVSWYTLHRKCIVNSSTSVNKKRKQKTNLFYEYCYEFVDRLKSLELKNFLYWFLFPETKIIFENYKTASFFFIIIIIIIITIIIIIIIIIITIIIIIIIIT